MKIEKLNLNLGDTILVCQHKDDNIQFVELKIIEECDYINLEWDCSDLLKAKNYSAINESNQINGIYKHRAIIKKIN